jgi:cation diffusion facilitator family transporter
VRGAYVEVVADALGSVGVIVAAGLMWVTGWGWVDPVIGAGIGLFILPRAWRLGRDAVRMLVQAAPEGVDLSAVTAALTGIDGVADVHDLHAWTLTSDMDVLTAHLGIAAGVAFLAAAFGWRTRCIVDAPATRDSVGSDTTGSPASAAHCSPQRSWSAPSG